MSRVDKRRHYQQQPNQPQQHQQSNNAVRLGAWSNYLAGYQISTYPTDCPIIIKTKQTEPAGNLYAAMDKWSAFARRFFRMRPDAHACYFLDASALFTGPGVAAASAGGAGMDPRELTQTGSLGESARPIRNVLSKLNSRGATLIAAGGVPGVLLMKLCAFNGISIWHEVVRRVVLFLPSLPGQWDLALLRGMVSAVLQQNASSSAAPIMPIAELCVVVASQAEMAQWTDVRSTNPLLHSFIVKMFANVRFECLPAVGGGNALVHFANILYPGTAPDLKSSLPPNRMEDVLTYEIRLMLSRYTKQVEQVVDAITLESSSAALPEGEVAETADDDGDDAPQTNDGNDDGAAAAAAAAAAKLQDDGVTEDDKQNSKEAVKVVIGAAAAAAASSSKQQQQPLSLLTADLSQLAVLSMSSATPAPTSVPVRLSGFVLDSDTGCIANAHGLFNVVQDDSTNVLRSFEGKAVKLVADAFLDEAGHVQFRAPRQILRVAPQEKETLLVPNSAFTHYAAAVAGAGDTATSTTSPSYSSLAENGCLSVPRLNSINNVTRQYGCILMRGRKVALVRDNASDPHLHFPAAFRQSLLETPIQCASRALCTLLDISADQFAVVPDIPPAVVYRREASLLGGSETVVTTLFVAVTVQAAPGGAARDKVQEELCLEDNYDWVSAQQADRLLASDEERTALRDAGSLLRRAVLAGVLEWPRDMGMIGDTVRDANDTLCVFVHCPFLDVSSEEAAKAVAGLFSAPGSKHHQLSSKVISAAGTKHAKDTASMAKLIAKSDAKITSIACPPSLSFHDTVFDIAPAVKKRNWAESRQVTVLTASRRVLAAFDGSESDVGIVSVAEDILEHSDEIVVVVESGQKKTADKKANDDDDDNAVETATILLALLHARKNESTAVWRAEAPIFVAASAATGFAGPQFTERLVLAAAAGKSNSQTPATWTHPSVKVVSVSKISGCNNNSNSNNKSTPAAAAAAAAAVASVQFPLNPAALLSLSTEEGVANVVRPLRLVHVRGTAWLAGCPAHSVRVSLRGGTDWSFSKAQPFDATPGHDIELVFCPATASTEADAATFWHSLMCTSDKEVQAVGDEHLLAQLPGWGDDQEGEEEEEEDDA